MLWRPESHYNPASKDPLDPASAVVRAGRTYDRLLEPRWLALPDTR